MLSFALMAKMAQYYIEKLTSILFSNTEISMAAYMNLVHITAPLEYILTALLEYINLLNKFLKGSCSSCTCIRTEKVQILQGTS